MEFSSLPDDIVGQIIGLLPQKDKASLALTAYKYYLLVQPKLYKNLLFTQNSALHCDSDFRCAQWTVVGGRSPLASKEANSEVFQLRQEVLLQSLTINHELCSHVTRVVYLQKGNDNLAQFLKANCPNLKEFVGVQLTREERSALTKLERVDVSDLNDLEDLPQSVRKVVFNPPASSTARFLSMKKDLAGRLANLDTLAFNDENAQVQVLRSLLHLYAGELHLRTLKLIHYHGFDDSDADSRGLCKEALSRVDCSTLRNLELVVGCDNMACNCLDEMDETLIGQPFQLKRLGIQQHTVHRDHNYSEKFDYYVTELITRLPNREHLDYLCISHQSPSDFNIGGGIKGSGLEGNWLKRRKLFLATLPALPGLKTLVLPHFLENASGYEQIVSDLLWNGCKCDHCKTYLGLFDSYIMRHQYYDGLEGYVSDMISPILFGSAGRELANRLVYKKGLLGVLQFPLLDTAWDFHSGNGICHFKQHEECAFNESIFPALATCISHFFVQNYVEDYGSKIGLLERVVMNGEVFEKGVRSGETTWTSVFDEPMK